MARRPTAGVFAAALWAMGAGMAGLVGASCAQAQMAADPQGIAQGLDGTGQGGAADPFAGLSGLSGADPLSAADLSGPAGQGDAATGAADLPGDAPGSNIPGSNIPDADIPGADLSGGDALGGSLPGTDMPADPVASLDAEGALPEANLADMRRDLKALGEALQTLRGELADAGPVAYQAAGGTDAITRMNTIEAEISRLTAAVEQTGKKVEAAIETASTRADDLEFRLCEVDPACDLGMVSTGQMQAGGGSGDDSSHPAPAPETLAERNDFARASAALDGGDYGAAAQLFGEFAARYPDAGLAPEALYLAGEAWAASGDTAAAGRAWLDAFSAAPNGPRAPAALLGMAQVIAANGAREDACGFFGEVAARYPNAPEALDAATRAEALGCPPSDAMPDDEAGVTRQGAQGTTPDGAQGATPDGAPDATPDSSQGATAGSVTGADSPDAGGRAPALGADHAGAAVNGSAGTGTAGAAGANAAAPGAGDGRD